MGVRSFEMSSTIAADARPDTVWATLTDAHRWPEWSRVCTSVSAVPDDWSPGQFLSFKMRIAGVPVPFNVSLTDIDTGRRVSWTSTKFTITAVRTISLEQIAGTVRITDHKRFSSPLLPVSVYYPRFLIRRMTETWLKDLKLESERADDQLKRASESAS